MYNLYLCNAFSLQMLGEFPVNVEISECTKQEIEGINFEVIPAINGDFDGLANGDENGDYKYINVMGHADTARVLGLEPNRINVKLEKRDIMFVAQLQGGRLPEGATTLPEGFSFKWLKVEIKDEVQC